MVDISREMVAYAIIGAMLLAGTPFVIALRRRRRHEKLRRRGIKTLGH